MDPDDLTAVDQTILDILHEGARTQSYIVDTSGNSKNWVNTRLQLLEANDHVEKIHEASAEYELRDDPRAEAEWPPYSILDCIQRRIERGVSTYTAYRCEKGDNTDGGGDENTDRDGANGDTDL